MKRAEFDCVSYASKFVVRQGSIPVGVPEVPILKYKFGEVNHNN